MNKIKNRYNFLFIIITCFYTNTCFCQSLIKENNNLITDFSSTLWISDTLGTNGYRMNVIKVLNYKHLIGFNKDEVKNVLGEPDFIVDSTCKSSIGEIGYIYIYNSSFLDKNNIRKNIENYKPNRRCPENKNYGSYIFISFDSEFNFVTHIFRYRSDE